LAVDDMDTIFLTGVTNSYNFPAGSKNPFAHWSGCFRPGG